MFEFKHIIQKMDYAFFLNAFPLALFFIFFCAVMLIVWLRPTAEYEDARNTPLDDN